MYATDLTPAQKAARTRAMKKADQAYEEMIAPEYTQWVEALDRLCPPRDAVIEIKPVIRLGKCTKTQCWVRTNGAPN